MAAPILEAQRAQFARDEHIKQRAERWRDATPEECLAATFDACELFDWLLTLMDPETREAALAKEPLPADTIAILEALQRVR